MLPTPRPGRRPLATLLLLAAAGAAGACNSDRVAGPAVLQLDPTAVLNAMANAGRFGSAASVGGGAVGVFTPGVLSSAGVSALSLFRDCAWTDAAQAFTCAPATLGGYTLTLTYAALDANGAPLRDPTPTTVAAVRSVLTTRGTTTVTPPTGPAVSVTLDQRQEATLRGFLGGPRVLDGTLTSTSQVRSDGPSGAVTGTVAFTQTTAGLTFPSGAGYPTAGTITTAVGDGASATPFVRQVLTFDGSPAAMLVFTLADGTVRRCTLDLAAASGGLGTTVRCAGA